MATDGEGHFVVAWLRGGGGYSYAGVYVHGRRYDSGGEPLGGEFQVTSIPGRYPYFPSVATHAGGDFTVVWSSLEVDGEYPRHVRGRRFCPDPDADGVCDADDNCPVDANPDQSDLDADGAGDVCDFCLGENATGDSDGDGVCDDLDACAGDDLTGDTDLDMICNDLDPCPDDASAECVFTDGFESGDTSAW